MIALALALALSAAPSNWRVSGSDVAFHMDAHSLAATRDAKPIWSLQKQLDDSLAELRTLDLGSFTLRDDLGSKQTLRVKCVIGTLVCLDDASSGDYGGQHSFQTERYEVFDVTRSTDPKSRISLRALFPESQIVDALKLDPFIAAHIGDRNAFAAATTIDALMRSLDAKTDCVSFDADALDHSFYFHHLEGAKVAVRIGLPYAAEVCRDHGMTVLGILLPIPKSLAAPLARAADRSEGFVDKDSKLVGAASASAAFKPSPPQFHKH